MNERAFRDPSMDRTIASATEFFQQGHDAESTRMMVEILINAGIEYYARCIHLAALGARETAARYIDTTIAAAVAQGEVVV